MRIDARRAERPHSCGVRSTEGGEAARNDGARRAEAHSSYARRAIAAVKTKPISMAGG